MRLRELPIIFNIKGLEPVGVQIVRVGQSVCIDVHRYHITRSGSVRDISYDAGEGRPTVTHCTTRGS